MKRVYVFEGSDVAGMLACLEPHATLSRIDIDGQLEQIGEMPVAAARLMVPSMHKTSGRVRMVVGHE